MCTVETGRTLRVEILNLKGDAWFRDASEKLARRERVIAISWTPAPYGAQEARDTRADARVRALIGAGSTT